MYKLVNYVKHVTLNIIPDTKIHGRLNDYCYRVLQVKRFSLYERMKQAIDSSYVQEVHDKTTDI